MDCTVFILIYQQWIIQFCFWYHGLHSFWAVYYSLPVLLERVKLKNIFSSIKEKKSNVFPIQFTEMDLAAIHNHLHCEVLELPCKHLGVPFSIRKLTRVQIQPSIDRIGDQLPGWKAGLLTKAGRKVLVQFVLTSMLVYLAVAVDFPSLAVKAIDKICRSWGGEEKKLMVVTACLGQNL